MIALVFCVEISNSPGQIVWLSVMWSWTGLLSKWLLVVFRYQLRQWAEALCRVSDIKPLLSGQRSVLGWCSCIVPLRLVWGKMGHMDCLTMSNSHSTLYANSLTSSNNYRVVRTELRLDCSWGLSKMERFATEIFYKLTTDNNFGPLSVKNIGKVLQILRK